jgi:hypothetical protein
VPLNTQLFLQHIQDAETHGNVRRLRRLRAIARHDNRPAVVSAADAALDRLKTSSAEEKRLGRRIQQEVQRMVARLNGDPLEDR